MNNKMDDMEGILGDAKDEEKCRLVIEFSAPGSVEFFMSGENVFPLQMLAVASYLELKAKMALQYEEAQQYQQALEQEAKKPKIVTPSDGQLQ